MHILNINSTLDSILGGGTAERTMQMSRYLSMEKKIVVSVLTLNIGITDQVKNKLTGVNLITIPCINNRFLVPFITNKKISESIRKADVIHLMSHWTIINLIAYFWILKYKKPYVVCPAGALPIFGRSKILKKLYNLLGGNSYIKNANITIAISNDELDHFLSYKVDKKNTLLIPNGIEPNSYLNKNDNLIRKKFSIGGSPFLLFVGRLNYIKGPDLLLEAFSQIEKKYPNYKLIFVGPDNGMKNSLILESEKLGLSDKVKFIGYVDGELKSMLFHAANLLVIPSRSEAMSIVVLESAITSTPVLMTNTCGLEEMTGANGAISVNPNAASISKGLLETLKKDSNLTLRGEKLKKYVESKFTWDQIVKEYIKMYENILSKSLK
jgi:glycosyltransferase involved in cell wall biosynthesis|tara:strand:- start:642 stop:1787 length:1146 start_codon:yes stop_codon:yes gene_type:complete